MILPGNTERGSLSDNRKSPLITLGLGDGTVDSEKTKVIPASQSWTSSAMQLLQGAETPTSAVGWGSGVRLKQAFRASSVTGGPEAEIHSLRTVSELRLGFLRVKIKSFQVRWSR